MRQIWAGLLWAVLFSFLANTSFAKQPHHWSKTEPAVSITHIFDGQINKRGKPTGFHHLGLQTQKNGTTARLQKILSPANKAGVYTALIEIWDANTNRWQSKFSSMFPNRLNRQQILKTIVNTFNHRLKRTGRKWRGRSAFGFDIEGYTLKDGRIITAYPIYKTGE